MKQLAEVEIKDYPAIKALVEKMVTQNADMEKLRKETMKKVLVGQDYRDQLWQDIHKECVKEKLVSSKLDYKSLDLEVDHAAGILKVTKREKPEMSKMALAKQLIEIGKGLGLEVPDEIKDYADHGGETVH